MQVDLELLLVIAAGPIRNQIRRRRRHRPPTLRQPADRDVVVVHDPALVANQAEHHHPLTRLDRNVQRTRRRRLLLRQPQQQRRRPRRSLRRRYMTAVARAAAGPHRIARPTHRPRRRQRHIRIANRRLRLRRSIGQPGVLGPTRGLDRLDMLRGLPAQILTALTEITAIRVLTATAWADLHETPARKVTHHTVPVKQRGTAWDPSR